MFITPFIIVICYIIALILVLIDVIIVISKYEFKGFYIKIAIGLLITLYLSWLIQGVIVLQVKLL